MEKWNFTSLIGELFYDLFHRDFVQAYQSFLSLNWYRERSAGSTVIIKCIYIEDA